MQYPKIGNIENLLASYLEQASFSKIGVLADSNTIELCYPIIKSLLPNHSILEIPDGEKWKNLGTCEKIWEWMTAEGWDRHALLINLGGGVIGDMGGFAAAAYKRGIQFINIPTTLLSMVDASVGGKLGIDYQGFKNHIGFFKDPETVLIDDIFLKTLPSRELRSGFAEVIKHSFISNEAGRETILKSDFPNLNWKEIIESSIKVKSNIVAQDPTEKGLRKVLNFGHTIGHAIESYRLESDKPLLHGEAIALGMMAETWLSVKKLDMDQNEANQVFSYIKSTYPDLSIEKDNLEKIVSLTLQDKKNKDGEVLCCLLSGFGDPQFDVKINSKEILESLSFIA